MAKMDTIRNFLSKIRTLFDFPRKAPTYPLPHPSSVPVSVALNMPKYLTMLGLGICITIPHVSQAFEDASSSK